MFFFFFFIISILLFFFFFFFQAEDGIRDIGVTGVQTCALPILLLYYGDFTGSHRWDVIEAQYDDRLRVVAPLTSLGQLMTALPAVRLSTRTRSEERRVGKECRSRWSREDERKRRWACASAEEGK